MAELGLDEAYISTLVETFYARVQNHPELGPIFNNQISQDWPAHLRTMKSFWSSVILKTNTFTGQPVPKHQKLTDVEAHHFQAWLTLFQQTLQETAPNPQVEEIFLKKANQIAKRLQSAMSISPS